MTNDALRELETWLHDTAASEARLVQITECKDTVSRWQKYADALSALLREREMAQEMFKDSANSMSHNQK